MRKTTKTEYPSIGETLWKCELDNGLRIRVVPKPGFHSYFAAFATNYGGAMRRFEIDGKTIDTPAGVAHYLEHKMFDLPDGDNALNLLTANGADPNAFTSSGNTCYYFECTTDFEENLKLLLHFVSTPYFTPETVEKERGIIGQEIQMGEDSPGSTIYYNLLSVLYDHHPIRDKVAGSLESIAQITDQTLYDCHKVFYAPSNMVLCVEGDVDPETVFQLAEDVLPKEKRSIPVADFGEPETLLPLQSRITASMPVSAPQYMIGAKIPADNANLIHTRLTASLALQLLLGNSSPFYSRLYADGTITHDFDYEIDYSAGTATLMISGESSDPERVRSEFLAEVQKVNANGFDPAYFNRIKKSAIGGKLRGLEDFDDVCISTALDLLDGFCFFESLDALAGVSAEDCLNFIRENLTEDRLAMSLLLPNTMENNES